MNRVNDFWDILRDIEGGRVLDVACGTGQFTRVLLDKLMSVEHITGLDPDGEVLREAKKGFNGQPVSFIQGSGIELPFSRAEFDMVCISKGLHHMENASDALMEMYRVLKEGGLFLVNEMYSNGLTREQESHMLYHHLRADIDRLRGISHNYTFTREQIHHHIMELNLSRVTAYEYNEDVVPPGDAGKIAEFSAKLDEWLPFISGLSEEAELRKKINAVRERIKKTGITRPPQLVILGRK